MSSGACCDHLHGGQDVIPGDLDGLDQAAGTISTAADGAASMSSDLGKAVASTEDLPLPDRSRIALRRPQHQEAPAGQASPDGSGCRGTGVELLSAPVVSLVSNSGRCVFITVRPSLTTPPPGALALVNTPSRV